MKVLYNYALNPWTTITMAFLVLKFWGLSFFFFFNRPHKHVIIQIRQVLTRIYSAQMLFMSCNWRLIISQTEREAILKNNLGCSPRQWSELSGRVSGKRNCQWFKKLTAAWYSDSSNALFMILHWRGAQIYSPGLHLFYSEDPGETSPTEWILTSHTLQDSARSLSTPWASKTHSY